jgi:hypothetical protein
VASSLLTTNVWSDIFLYFNKAESGDECYGRDLNNLSVYRFEFLKRLPTSPPPTPPPQ